MAAKIGPGAVSLLDFADRLWQVPVGFAMSGLLVTTLAHWSERLYGGGTVRALSATIDGHSRLTAADQVLLADMLAILVAAIPVYVAGLTYTRAFLVLKRSDLLLVVGVTQLVAKTGLKPGSGPAITPRLVGIAPGTALTFTVTSMALMAVATTSLVHQAVTVTDGARRQ